MALNRSKMLSSPGSLPVKSLDALLLKSIGRDVKINDVSWKHLTDPGENFGSLILAINVNLVRDNHPETINLVVKLPPRSAYLLDLFNSPVTFQKELTFYSDVAPALKEIQCECGTEKDIISLVPKFFAGRLGLKDSNEFDEQAAIVLENLNYAGYSVQDRIWGLDKTHVQYAVRELAKLHAVIIALKFRRPQFFEKTVMSTLTPATNDAAKNGVLNMINKARENLTGIEQVKPYLDRIYKTLDYGIENDDNNQLAEEPWSTLVHNDFWVNNMMFRYDKLGNIADMKMVDFQLCIYGYGLNDLIFFLISSAKREVLDDNLDEMLDLYYDSFIHFLKSLKVDIAQFPKHKFVEHLNYCAPIKFAQCIMMVQVIQATRGSAQKMENIGNKDDFLNLTSERNVEKLLQIVSIFDKKGWLLR